MEIKEYSRHVYDLELKSLLDTYKNEIKKVKLSAANETQTPEYFVNLITVKIKEYCKFKRIQFRKGQIIVMPDALANYDYFLGLSLVFYHEHKMRQYLNYQQKKFQSFSKPETSFVDLIEFVVVDIVKWSSPFDNSKRLSIIMDWVDSERTVVPQKKEVKNSKATFLPESPKDFLKWQKGISLLKSLSAKLQGKYISRRNDFEEVFNSQKELSGSRE